MFANILEPIIGRFISYERTDAGYIYRMNLAGTPKSAIAVQTRGNTLIIRVNKDVVADLRVPSDIQVDTVKAIYLDGVLAVEVSNSRGVVDVTVE